MVKNKNKSIWDRIINFLEFLIDVADYTSNKKNKNKFYNEEEEDQDHYSFWNYNPMSWGFRSWTCGPFGPRKRR